MTDYKAGQRKFDRWLTDDRGIELARVVDNGLQRDDSGWDHFSYTMIVKGNGHIAEFPYHAGTAHRGKPRLVDIIAALFSDAQCVADNDFRDFCAELGYDSDSRKAENMFRQIQVQNAELLRLFGETNLNTLLRLAEPYVEGAGL